MYTGLDLKFLIDTNVILKLKLAIYSLIFMPAIEL